MELNIRELNESDYDLLSKWWNDWGWTPVEKDMLPANGTGGLMIEKDGEPILAGFIFWTNAKWAILDYIVSDKTSSPRHRQHCLESLIVFAEEMVERADYKYLYSFTQHTGLIKTHKKFGWNISKNNIFKMFKTLKK